MSDKPTDVLTQAQKDRIIQCFLATIVSMGVAEFERQITVKAADMPDTLTLVPPRPKANGHWMTRLTPRQKAAQVRKMHAGRWPKR